MHSVDALLAYVSSHHHITYAVVFLCALAESLALVGLLVPGTMIIFGIGAIVATDNLDLAPVWVLATAGAFTGDSLSYWLGHHYRQELQGIWPFSRHPALLKNGVAFFHRHGGKSVMLGRFVGPIRAVIPVVAGMLGMRPLHFTLVNAISAAAWAIAYLLPGVLFGTSLVLARQVSMRLAALMFMVTAALFTVYWLGRKLLLTLWRVVPGWIVLLQDWAARDIPETGLLRRVKFLISFIFRSHHGEEVLVAALVFALIAAGWGFLGVLQDVLAKDPLVLADRSIYHFFQSLRSPWADNLFVFITEFGDSFVNTCLAAAVLAVLLLRRCYTSAGFWLAAALGGVAGVQLLKWAIHLPRPAELYQGASTFGFPSGHTTMSMVLYGFLAILVSRGTRGSAELGWGSLLLVFLYVFTIALSRVYLGAHWFSDVLGGFLIGTSWVALLGFAYLKRPPEMVPRRLLLLTVALVVLLAGGWHAFQRHGRDLGMYAPRHVEKTWTLAAWLGGGWRELPPWRVDMAGELEQPMTLQWAGAPEALARYLGTTGWQPSPPFNLHDLLGMLSPDTPIGDLPVLPRLNSGRQESLQMVLVKGDLRWVLRLWATEYRLAGDRAPISVGTVEIQRLRHLSWLITATEDTGRYSSAMDLFAQQLEKRFPVLSVSRTPEHIRADGEPHPLQWAGRVLLVWNRKT